MEGSVWRRRIFAAVLAAALTLLALTLFMILSGGVSAGYHGTFVRMWSHGYLCQAA
ncbi:MAG: hypothetical protein LBK41_00835 [Clostridiales bacterium]|jgi:hypothetical protein|nr:hypothetical protein [Clostridiales bacterium]